jgi:hypothetical protein
VCSNWECSGSPGPGPDEIDDSVRVVRTGGTATISWHDPPGSYDVYRGSVGPGVAWDYNQTCFAGPTGASSVPDGVAPGPGGLFFYLVARRTTCGESIQGRNSQGAPIPASSPCP